MSSEIKPLAVFGAIRFVGWARFEYYESMYFTKDKLYVERNDRPKDRQVADFSPEELLKANKNNFALAYTEVERVELKKSFKSIPLKIHSGGQKYHWNIRFMLGNEFLEFDDVKRVLQQIFSWKLDAPEEF